MPSRTAAAFTAAIVAAAVLAVPGLCRGTLGGADGARGRRHPCCVRERGRARRADRPGCRRRGGPAGRRDAGGRGPQQRRRPVDGRPSAGRGDPRRRLAHARRAGGDGRDRHARRADDRRDVARRGGAGARARRCARWTTAPGRRGRSSRARTSPRTPAPSMPRTAATGPTRSGSVTPTPCSSRSRRRRRGARRHEPDTGGLRAGGAVGALVTSGDDRRVRPSCRTRRSRRPPTLVGGATVAPAHRTAVMTATGGTRGHHPGRVGRSSAGVRVRRRQHAGRCRACTTRRAATRTTRWPRRCSRSGTTRRTTSTDAAGATSATTSSSTSGETSTRAARAA